MSQYTEMINELCLWTLNYTNLNKPLFDKIQILGPINILYTIFSKHKYNVKPTYSKFLRRVCNKMFLSVPVNSGSRLIELY